MITTPTIETEPCTDGERTFYAELLLAHEQAKRDVQVAWTAFCHAHSLPLTTELEGVSPHGVLVKRPQPAGDG